MNSSEDFTQVFEFVRAKDPQVESLASLKLKMDPAALQACVTAASTEGISLDAWFTVRIRELLAKPLPDLLPRLHRDRPPV